MSDGGPPWRWIRQADLWDISDAFHDTVRGRRSAEGDWAVIECVVGDNHRLRDCTIVEQSDETSGVAEAAIIVSRAYLADRHDTTGAPTPGRRVHIGLGYGGTVVP